MARVPEGSWGAAQVAGITWAPAVEGGSLLFGFLRLSSLWPYIDGARGGRRGWGEGWGCLEPRPRTPVSPALRAEASPACASAAVGEVETTSQASEPASQASDEEDAPAADLYFVSHPGLTPLAGS